MADPHGQQTAEAASRAMSDAAFAQEVLAGDEYPAVKAALLADLAEATESAEVSGFMYQPSYTSYSPPSAAQVNQYFTLASPTQFSNLNGLRDRAARW